MLFKKKDNTEYHTEYGIVSNSIYILGKIRKYKPLVLIVMVVGMFTMSMMRYLWSFIGKFVIDIVQQQSQNPSKDIKPLIILLCITTIIELCCLVADTIMDNRRWFNFIYIRMKVITERIAKVLSIPYEMLEQPKVLDMHSKATQATGGNNNGIEGMMHSIYWLGVQVFTIVATLSIIATLNLWIVLVIAVFSFVQYLFFRYTVKKDKKEVWDQLAPTWRKINYMERTTQDFDYAKDIRLFGMKNWLSAKQHEILFEKLSKIIRNKNLWIYNTNFSHSIGIVRDAFIYGILIWSVLYNNLTIGNFTLYLGTAMTFSSTLTQFLNSFATYKQRSMEVDDFRSFMDYSVETNKEWLPIPKSDTYTFTFENVSFRYPEQSNYALKNLNLTLEPGKRLAVVGLNGAGKTTFIKLLLRLYDVTEGRILLNGIDIRQFNLEEYFNLFAPVFQNIEIFAFPLAENVSMKKPEATDKNLSKECLIKAGMEEKLEALPAGVDTQLLKVLFEDGVDLSGGEKQKLALARALYKDAPIIVLDEPTAALDALAEYNLYKSFDEIIGSKSAIYISHRLSSTRFCDNIAMFKGGEMVEYGSHEELLSKGNEYATLFEVQAQYYKETQEVC